ncbi:hypothetical protein BGW38_009550, partial [Lunasporangiospora selenospora]
MDTNTGDDGDTGYDGDTDPNPDPDHDHDHDHYNNNNNNNNSPAILFHGDPCNTSLSSAFDSQPSNRSSSSSIDGWAPRARSSSVSSNGSNDSVNLDALIASGSDINEECLLDLEEADDVEWSSRELLNRKELQEQALANVASLDDPNEFDSDRYDPEHHWSDPD